ncbi:hypothetical protein F4780DRAFT_776109 [Xylariomycetidae sp. FL0641]|nr:hypothetical protein F4780DRAFT_776109 [Xylariomycetidae sp. FL0641]
MDPKSTTGDDRKRLVDAMKNLRVTVPDSQRLMSQGPAGCHPDVQELNMDLKAKIQSILDPVRDEGRIRKIEAADYATFTASWWLYAAYEELRIAMYMSLWLFIWDDGSKS